jgi:hypothetical protein
MGGQTIAKLIDEPKLRICIEYKVYLINNCCLTTPVKALEMNCKQLKNSTTMQRERTYLSENKDGAWKVLRKHLILCVHHSPKRSSMIYNLLPIFPKATALTNKTLAIQVATPTLSMLKVPSTRFCPLIAFAVALAVPEKEMFAV